MAATKKEEFSKWAEGSGASQLISKAMVALSKQQASDATLSPAAFLAEFFAKGAEGDASAELTKEQRDTFGAYLKSSGATVSERDLTRARGLRGLARARDVTNCAHWRLDVPMLCRTSLQRPWLV